MAYYGHDSGLLQGAQLPFNFHLIGAHWQATSIDRLVRDYEAALPPGAAPNWVLGNHDKPRIASRVGAQGARLAAMLLLTLRGTPTLYYGDELGLADVPIPPREVQDPFEKNEPGKGLGRDPQRTPMPWDGSANGGFTSGWPWLRLGPQAASHHVRAQQADPGSMLSLYRRLLMARRRHPALHRGRYEPVAAIGDLLAYVRVHGDERVCVALNFGAAPVALPPSWGAAAPLARHWWSTMPSRERPLKPGEPLQPH